MAANNDSDLELLEEVVVAAGDIAMKYFKSDNQVWMKPGDSPVSQADFAVNEYLEKHLLAARPNYGWISEETDDNDERLDRQRVFIVDPIDGTRGFINGSDKWCISVAIVEMGKPVAGVLQCPALGEFYRAKLDSVSTMNGDPIQVSQSESIRQVTGTKKIIEIVNSTLKGKVEAGSFVPSLAYRIAMVANGAIDVAYARAGAHDWDLAAADLILANAGGALVDSQGSALEYNRKKLHRDALIASSIELRNPAIELAKSADILH